MLRWGCALALLLSLSTPSAFAEGDGAEAALVEAECAEFGA